MPEFRGLTDWFLGRGYAVLLPQRPGHGATGGCGQIQRLGQRHEAYSEMLQFLQGCQQIRYRPAPAVQSPNQHDIDLSAAGGLQQFLTSFSLGRTGANLRHR
jgi:alpha-beta hydrolase superfamily lysophospholipase